MSLRQLGLIVVGAFFVLGSLLLFIAGDVVTGAGSLLFALVMIVVPVSELLPDGSGPRLEDGALVVRVNRVRRVLLTVGAVLFAASSGLLVAGAGGPFARLAGARRRADVRDVRGDRAVAAAGPDAPGDDA